MAGLYGKEKPGEGVGQEEGEKSSEGHGLSEPGCQCALWWPRGTSAFSPGFLWGPTIRIHSICSLVTNWLWEG